MLAGPALAQATPDYVVRFTGFLGDLRFPADQTRAQLIAEDDETARVAVALVDESIGAFTLFTRTHVNNSVNMYICGQQVATTTVQAPVDSGFAQSDPLPLETAQAMVDALNGLGECPEAE